MGIKDDLINSAFGYRFKGNQRFNEEYCNNFICCMLRNLDECSAKKNRCTLKDQKSCNNELGVYKQWCRELTKGIEGRVDLAHITPGNKMKADLLAEVKIFKTYQDVRAIKIEGHEYPFLFLDGSFATKVGQATDSNNIMQGVICDGALAGRRRKELVATCRCPNNVNNRLHRIFTDFSCIRQCGEDIIVTDADEGQLFKDFVKMLKYHNSHMVQIIYIVTPRGKWQHVHDPNYITEKLNHLFGIFYNISSARGAFKVYDYMSLCPLIDHTPNILPLPTGKTFFQKHSVHNHDITCVVIDWGNPTAAATGILPVKVFP